MNAIFSLIFTRSEAFIRTLLLCLVKERWEPHSKSLFIYRAGTVAFDVGHVGQVESKKMVHNNAWHHVALTYQKSNNQVRGLKPQLRTHDLETCIAGHYLCGWSSGWSDCDEDHSRPG